ncbi:MAG: hypothetical protein ACR2JM_04995, partial [Mycobacterium sp.]
MPASVSRWRGCEAVNDVVGQLRALEVHREGTIDIQRVDTLLSADGFNAELLALGSSADAVVWADVAQRSYEESELSWTSLSFMSPDPSKPLERRGGR